MTSSISTSPADTSGFFPVWNDVKSSGNVRDFIRTCTKGSTLPDACLVGQFWWKRDLGQEDGVYMPWMAPFETKPVVANEIPDPPKSNRKGKGGTTSSSSSSLPSGMALYALFGPDAPPLRAEGGVIVIGVYMKRDGQVEPLLEKVLKVPVLSMPYERVQFNDGTPLPSKGGGWQVTGVDLCSVDLWERTLANTPVFSSLLKRRSLLFEEGSGADALEGYTLYIE